MKSSALKQFRRLKKNRGATLLELLIWLMLTMLLITAVIQLLATSIANWRMINSQTALQQTVRFAVDSMVRDIQFAQRISLDNDRKITVTTGKYGKNGQQITYTYDTRVMPHVLRRDKNDGSGAQPMTGGNSNTVIHIRDCRFVILATDGDGFPRTVQIEITACDTGTGRHFTLQTAVTGRLVNTHARTAKEYHDD